MSLPVNLTPRAERDVDHILSWLSERSPQGASAWWERWLEVLELLATADMPHSHAPENEDHAQEIFHVIFKTRRGRNYRAIYTISGSSVIVLHVRGPGQDIVPNDQFRGI